MTAPSGGASSVHQEIAKDIGQQVETMILAAKRNSETKVSAEIQKIKVRIEQLNAKIKATTERANRLDPASAGSILKADLQKKILKLEEVWEGEMGTLKHELWQTIQAHNHNADLMKHHRDAIDQIQVRMTETASDPEVEQIQTQLLQVDKLMQKEAAKQHQIELFVQRLTLLEQQLSPSLGLGAGWPGAMPGFPMAGALGGLPPGVRFPPGVAQGANPSAAASAAAAAAFAAQSKKAPKKTTKPKKSPASSASPLANTLRAEAPPFVPTVGGSGWDR